MTPAADARASFYSLTRYDLLEGKAGLLSALELPPVIVLDRGDMVLAKDDRVSRALTLATDLFGTPPIIHLPFRGLLLGHRDSSAEQYVHHCLESGAALVEERGSAAVMHALLPPDLADPDIPAVTSQARRVLGPIVRRLRDAGLPVYIENTYERSCEAFAQVVDHLEVGAILDIPRIAMYSVDTVAEWLSRVRPLAGMHMYGSKGGGIHERLTPADCHWFSQVLQQSGPAPILLLDTPRPDLEESVRLARSWVMADASQRGTRALSP